MDSARIDQTLVALADPTRRKVVEYLKTGPKKASELADLAGASRPLMSRHLKILLNTHLVHATRVENDARLRYFELNGQPLSELSEWLEEIRRFWDGQLAGFKAFVEGSGESV